MAPALSDLNRRDGFDTSAIRAVDATSLIATSYALIALAWITLGLRLWTRLQFVKKLAWDDAWMIVTAVLCLPQMLALLLLTSLGMLHRLRCCIIKGRCADPVDRFNNRQS